MTGLPSVDVVIPTRDRPELLRAAIDSVRTQEYGGRVRVIVVFDGTEPDAGVERADGVPVMTVRNGRTPGLCGTRNTGILAGDGDLVAFLDDDDRWLPGKLDRQVSLLLSQPDVPFASTATRVEFGTHHTDRYAGTDAITHERLLESIFSMAHSSTFLIRRAALVGAVGLVDEDAPGGQNEDYDLKLRYSAAAPIAHLDEPLVAVRWGSTSLFALAWAGKLAGAEYILGKHPDITTSAVGYARLLGQIAFAQAALHRRRAALRTVGRMMRVRPREPRGYLALLVLVGIPPGTVLGVLHRRGRGI